MSPVALSDIIAVGEVPTSEQIAVLARAGFRSILNTQPEGEVERLMTSAQCFTQAQSLGLAYRHLPIVSRRPAEYEIAAFARAIAEMPRPIYACCYSGSRSAAVWALAAAETQPPATIIAACADAGYDITFLAGELDRRHAAANSENTAAGALPNGTIATARPAELNGAAAGTMPRLVADPVIPRAASSGGFAVAG